MNKEFFQKNRGLIIAAVVIIILIVISATRNDDTKTAVKEENAQEQSMEETAKDNTESKDSMDKNSQSSTNTSTQGQLVREGVLLSSDDQARGNYMVKTSNSIFYLKTSKDFSSLLNKEVKFIADGTVEKFSLVDIVAK